MIFNLNEQSTEDLKERLNLLDTEIGELQDDLAYAEHEYDMIVNELESRGEEEN